MAAKKAKKKAKKKATKKATKKTAKKSEVPSKGIGKKLAVYVPKEDEWVIGRLEEIQSNRRAEGYRTSLSYELIRLVKERLQQM